MNEFVTVVNRTNQILTGTFDGRQYEIVPGKQEFSKEKALRFKDQNPVMGSEDPRTGSAIYKIGIVELRDPVDPIPTEVIAKYEGQVERWDRSKLVGARPVDIVPGDNGLYSRHDASPGGLPSNGSFVKP